MIAPEDLYPTVHPAAKQRFRIEVVAKYAPLAAAYVRRYFAPEHRAEAEQVAAIGILVALEKWDPTRPRVNEDAFWGFATLYVRDELRKWADVGIRWRKSAKSKKRPHEAPAIVPLEGDEPAAGPDVEALTAEVEIARKLRKFAETLTERDYLTFISTDARVNRSSRYYDLVRRARIYVRGK
jgi:DNA-directed RNA polymerase specialized sigma subunit